MRDNKKLINIRVTEKEKQKLEQLAGKCGLSLSEYLRQRGLGYAPGPALDERFYEVYSRLCDISNLPLSRTPENFRRRLLSLGYSYARDDTHREPSVMAPGWKRPVRLRSIGYTAEVLNRRLEQNWEDVYFIHWRNANPMKKATPLLVIEQEYRKAQHMDGIRLTFAILIELLRLCTGEISRQKARPLSPMLREEVRKLDQYMEDYQLLCAEGIGTAGELSAFRDGISDQIRTLEAEREQIRNRIRRAAPEATPALKEQAKGITAKLTPLVVRPVEGGEYEVISGHRRLHACKKAGIETVPALIYSLDRDAAAIALVDSNLHRERILPSEKAFAYKLKRDALSHQGKTSHQVGEKLTTAKRIGMDSGDSMNQVLRYIRLTNLIPEILHMVDDGRIALTPAVELSYLTEPEQQDLLETMESEDCSPSLSQAQQLRRLSQSGKLTMDTIFALLTVPKANQWEKVSFYVDELRGFFPRHYTAAQIQKCIVDMLQRSRGGREER